MLVTQRRCAHLHTYLKLYFPHDMMIAAVDSQSNLPIVGRGIRRSNNLSGAHRWTYLVRQVCMRSPKGLLECIMFIHGWNLSPGPRLYNLTLGIAKPFTRPSSGSKLEPSGVLIVMDSIFANEDRDLARAFISSSLMPSTISSSSILIIFDRAPTQIFTVRRLLNRDRYSQ
jgi:hypothetical protein